MHARLHSFLTLASVSLAIGYVLIQLETLSQKTTVPLSQNAVMQSIGELLRHRFKLLDDTLRIYLCREYYGDPDISDAPLENSWCPARPAAHLFYLNNLF